MADQFAFTEGADGEFVALSGRQAKGKLFRKHILTKGILNYQGQKMRIDDKFIASIKKNFDDKVCDIVQVPVAGAKNEHTEDPFRNVGEVVDVEVQGDKVYAVIDVRDKTAVEKIEDKLFLGASAMFGMNYTDTRDGQRKGPTLCHVAITNRPHELELEEFEVLSLSADSSQRAVLLTAADKEISMDLDDLIAILRDDHGIDVPELQRQAAEVETVAALSNSLREALGASEVVELSAESGNDDIVAAVGTLIESNVALSAEIASTKEAARVDAATAEVDSKVKGGFILPAKRDRFLELRLSNEELYNDLLPEQPIVALSAEEGIEPADETPGEVLDREVQRYAEAAKAAGISVGE
jgi:hypothetical protein